MAGGGRGRGRGQGRPRQKMRLLSEIIERLDRVPKRKPVEQPTKAELLPEVLEVIISRLTLRDNIRASVVCKSWLKAAIAVRKANKPPLLIIFPKLGEYSYEFYDVSQRKSFWLDLPELLGSEILCAKDRWLMLNKTNTELVFFFCPYTRELIRLPDMDLATYVVSFSAAPTSPNCVIFAIRSLSPTGVAMSTWRSGETKWSHRFCDTIVPFICRNIVSFDGLFCCLAKNGQLGSYNSEKITWTTYSIEPPSFPDSLFLAEQNGDIFIIYTYSNKNPTVVKFDLTERRLDQMESLGGMTFFLNRLACLARTDLLGRIRNKVYFSKVLYYGNHCVSYSVDQGRYYPRNEVYKWSQQNLDGSIWIEPPENLSPFL